ncbi:2-keto-4-pentenoate hydratase [Rhodococcus sp. NPDC003382]|uniref:2-keto-4-pentenoate hydratase n=1 Tax=Rhodococcus sp. O3 TaxID=3404919 RepID=UPI003B685AC6
MTETSVIEQIADELYRARRDVTTMDFVSPRLPERDLDAAYSISELVAARREAELGVRRVGRKVGLTNPLVQKRVGVFEPDYGIIHDDMVHSSGVVIPASAHNFLRIEAEVAFVLAKDILVADPDAIEDAIEYITPAFELVDFRFAGNVGKIVDTIADNAGCDGVVLGEERHAYGEVDLTGVEMSITTATGDEITRGVGSNVLGHPIKAVQWLAETALRIGHPLRAGEILLSGSIGYIEPWPADVECTATITGLGCVRATLDSKA